MCLFVINKLIISILEFLELEAGENAIYAESEIKDIFNPRAADEALFKKLNEERKIYVYNNEKEVVTHTNYSYEELATGLIYFI